MSAPPGESWHDNILRRYPDPEPARERERFSLNDLRSRRRTSDAAPEPEPVGPLNDRARELAAVYVENAVSAITTELLDSASWPEDRRNAKGQGWELMAFQAAARLGALARAPWNALTMAEAERLFLAAAPTGPRWTARDVAGKWRYHSTKDPAAAMPSGVRAAAEGRPVGPDGVGQVVEVVAAEMVGQVVHPPPTTTDPRAALGRLLADLRTWQHLPDPVHILVSLAAAATRSGDGEPCWVLMVASTRSPPPGCSAGRRARPSGPAACSPGSGRRRW